MSQKLVQRHDDEENEAMENSEDNDGSIDDAAQGFHTQIAGRSDGGQNMG